VKKLACKMCDHGRVTAKLVRTGMIALALSILLHVGCDDQTSNVESFAQEPTSAPATSPAFHSADQLLNGPRKEIPLLVVPLSARVPEGWAVEQNEGGRLLFLQGQGLTQFVQIQLSRRPSLSKTQYAARLEAIEIEKTKNTKSREVLVRSIEGLTVVERTAIETLPSMPIVDDAGNAITVTSPPFRWTLFFYRDPGEASKEVDVFELNFVGLNVEQYTSEKNFLRGIIDSIRFDRQADQPIP
jgi:hypothetical protein